jgi:hypothetical protein
MISAHICMPHGPEASDGPHDERAPSEPAPFSYDSHFSISRRNAVGYRLQVIDEVIVIGGNGQIVAVEYPETPSSQRRRKRDIPVPSAAVSKRHDYLRFLWGPGHHVFGLSDRDRGGAWDDALALEDYRRYEALHRHILEGVGDIALQAFLRFLDRNAGGMSEEYLTIVERLGSNLAFRFHYDEHYLHERHAAQLAWRRFLMEHADAPEPRLSLLGSAGDASPALQLSAGGLEGFLTERR